MIVQETSKKYAYGFNMRTETYTRELMTNLEETDIKTIFNFVNNNKDVIGLLAQYFQEHGYTMNEIEKHTPVHQRTLHRYIKQLEV